jgi:hypothetical protein
MIDFRMMQELLATAAVLRCRRGGDQSSFPSAMPGADLADVRPRRLSRRHHDDAQRRSTPPQPIYDALADVVCKSPEFGHLFSEVDKTRARLRGLRKCFRTIQDGLSSHMPGPIMSRWQGVVPLDYT